MISGVVVVDASVVVEYLVDLGLGQQASSLFAGLVDPESGLELWAPDLVYAESASALRKLVLHRAISAKAGEKALDRLLRLPLAATGTAALMPAVWRLRGRVTPYDACYVALARRLNAPLVTADERLARAFARSRDRVIALATLLHRPD